MIASLIYQCVPVPCDFTFLPFYFFTLKRSVSHATRGRDGRQEGRERGYYHLHRNLNNSLFHRLFRLNVSWRWSLSRGLAPMIASLIYQWGLTPVIGLYGLVFVQAFATISAFTADARADHEGRSLSGHSEATGIHAIVLSQFDSRAVDGCRRHLTLSRRDADLHLIVLVEGCTRGHSVAIMSDGCTTTTAGCNSQRIAALLVLLTL